MPDEPPKYTIADDFDPEIQRIVEALSPAHLARLNLIFAAGEGEKGQVK
jgi:hypothetical protein